MSTLEEVARFCEPGARRNYHKISLTETLPTTPGVYVMRDDKGAALYIGKAENLRRRTRDHFLQRQAYHARQALELLRPLRRRRDRLRVRRPAARAAAHRQAPAAVQLARHARAPATTTSSSAPTSTRACTPRPTCATTARYYAGPFRKASLARRLVECLNGVYPLRTCAHLPARRRGAPAGAAARPRLPARRHRRLPGALQPAAQRRVRGRGRRRAPRPRGPRRRPRRAPAGAPGRHGAGPGVRAGGAPAEAARGAGARAAHACAACAPRRRDDAVIAYPAKRAGWVALWGVRGGRIAVERVVGRGAFGEDAARGFLAELAAAAPPAPPLPADACSTRCCSCTPGCRATARRRTCSTCAPWSPAGRLSADARRRSSSACACAPPRRRPAERPSGGAGPPYSSSARPRPRRSSSTATTADAPPRPRRPPRRSGCCRCCRRRASAAATLGRRFEVRVDVVVDERHGTAALGHPRPALPLVGVVGLELLLVVGHDERAPRCRRSAASGRPAACAAPGRWSAPAARRACRTPRSTRQGRSSPRSGSS